MIAIGTPYWTERLIVPTSRVTRVTRSPVLALSTRPSGSARIVRTTYSRADDSRSWPKIVEVRWARKVSRAWVQTTTDDQQGERVEGRRGVAGDGPVDQRAEQAGYDQTGRGGQSR